MNNQYPIIIEIVENGERIECDSLSDLQSKVADGITFRVIKTSEKKYFSLKELFET